MSESPPDPSGGFAAAPEKRPSKRGVIIQLVVAAAVMVLIFGFVLPQVVDYDQVWQTIKTLSVLQLLILLGAGLFLYVPEGWLYAILLPGMTLWQGMKAWVSSTAVATTIPGADLVTRYGMYRSYGHDPESSMAGIVLSGVFDNFVKFSLPVIAVLIIGFSGIGGIDDIIIVGLIAAAVLIVTIVVVVGVVRSERFTRGVATRIQSVVNWGLSKFKKDLFTDLPERVVGFRDGALIRVKAVWLKALLASVLGKLWAFVILFMAMRFVGIGPDVLSALDIFLVWSLVLLLQSIPLTPGGIGIAAIGYIGLFTAIAGKEWANAIGAGVALFRVVQWAMPIPIGWGVVWNWRRRVARGDLPDPFAAVAGDPNHEE